MEYVERERALSLYRQLLGYHRERPPMNLDRIDTLRLRGERLARRHAEIWEAMGADAALMATLGGAWSTAEAREKLEWNVRQWEQHGHGQWLFFLREGGTFVGRGGIRKMMVNQTEEIELGYSVMPALWGYGYAPEMATKALNIAFTTFHYPSVVAFTGIQNRRSERVMQKLGFQFEATIDHGGAPHVLYRLRNPNTADEADGK
jgi:RimJ/RimL family protein N-acetyltransferase